MTNRAFMDAVRQFGSFARRFRRSYAAQVHVLAQARVDAIHASDDAPEDKAKQVADLQAFLNREYQPNDDAFAMQSYG